MRGLHNLVQQGKVLYLVCPIPIAVPFDCGDLTGHEMKGVSDTPAWVVSRANQYARDHALTPFVIYQGAWNVLERSFERDIIPMARAEGSSQTKDGNNLTDHQRVGMALAPWNVLAAGKIRSDAEEERRRQTGENGRTLSNPNWERNEKEKAVCNALEKVAQEIGAKSITAGLFRHLPRLAQFTNSLPSVAIAYLLHKTPYVFPIIGGRKIEHLLANIEALELSLSDEQIQYLESIVPLDLGFPGTMIVSF